MNILFLDYDGVVNTPQWSEPVKIGQQPDAYNPTCTYGYPSDGAVNDFQAVQWVSEFCQRFGYSIVVTSSWRIKDNWKQCLIDGGLRDGIEILGATPIGNNRGEKITSWLNDHPEVENYIILDDEDVAGHEGHLVKCGIDGFHFREYEIASGMADTEVVKRDSKTQLTSENVNTIADRCAITDSDEADENSEVYLVKGTAYHMVCRADEIEKYHQEIKAMLYQLPNSFREGIGGGDVFTHMFHDKNGNVWGDVVDLEVLLCLGIAAGYVKTLTPLTSEGKPFKNCDEYCVVNKRISVETVPFRTVPFNVIQEQYLLDSDDIYDAFTGGGTPS